MPASTMTPAFIQDPLGKHSAYVSELSHRYAALSRVALEEEEGPLSCSCHGVDEERTRWLRERVQDAWVKADGNPANGQWSLVTNLLCMGVTSGRNGRWIGARMDIKSPAISGLGWLNASSEAEWDEWEKKFDQNRVLNDKVENWKRNLELHHNEADSAKQTPAVAQSLSLHEIVAVDGRFKHLGSRQPSLPTKTPSTAVTLDPLKNAAPFGFGVIKRSSQLSVVHEKHAASVKQKGSSQSRPGNSQVANNPDSSLVPPSFSSSQLFTSTPKKFAKPNPLAAAQNSSPLLRLSSSSQLHDTRTFLARSSSLASPKSSKIAGTPNLHRRRDETSASLPAIPFPTTPMRNPTSQHSEIHSEHNVDLSRRIEKRALPPSIYLDQGSHPDDRKVKRAKITHDIHPRNPVTPDRPHLASGAMPTLTELLASARKSKKNPLASVAKPVNPDLSPGLPIIADRKARLGGALPLTGIVEDEEMPSASPAKSLSSIDAKDKCNSGCSRGGVASKLAFDLDSPFRPVATSTQQDHNVLSSSTTGPKPNQPIVTQPHEQHPGANATDSWESIYATRPNPVPPSSSLPPNPPDDGLVRKGSLIHSSSSSFPKLSLPTMYNSQFESAVAMQVDMVDKLLERDVEYGSWLRKDDRAPDHPTGPTRKEDCYDSDDSRSERSTEDPSSPPAFSSDDSAVMRGEHDPSYGYGKAFERDQSF